MVADEVDPDISTVSLHGGDCQDEGPQQEHGADFIRIRLRATEKVAPGYAVRGCKHHEHYHYPANNQQEAAQTLDYIIGGVFKPFFQICSLSILISLAILPARYAARRTLRFYKDKGTLSLPASFLLDIIVMRLLKSRDSRTS
jgi:hypothetical protein